jgi:hypothetical protein
MSYNNLTKLFRYVNNNGDSVVFDYDGGYLINKPSGIDALSINLSQAKGIDQTGATIQSTNIQPRPVTITGYFVGEMQPEKKERLISVIRPDLGGKLYADDFYLNVWPTSTPTIEARSHGARFQLSLLAAYPYWCKDDSTSAGLSSVEKNFKFPWNMSRAYRFGTVKRAQFIDISNRGQIPIPFTVTFTAMDSVVNPKLIDATTNKFLLLKKNLVAGERVVVEITHERTSVTSSIDGECRGALDLKSNFFRLNVGDNVLKPEAESGLANMRVNIDFAVEIVGIAL